MQIILVMAFFSQLQNTSYYRIKTSVFCPRKLRENFPNIFQDL